MADSVTPRWQIVECGGTYGLAETVTYVNAPDPVLVIRAQGDNNQFMQSLAKLLNGPKED